MIKSIMKRDNIRNIAIIAHVDHGKTTMVDAMLKQTHTVKENSETKDLIMDSMDLERERGITIRAKNASLVYNGTKINIVDTPGHADFGGEVERTLRMADGVLLLVDAKEGPMPQTKFVLKKALELGLKAIVVVNKVDKPDAQVDHTVNKTFDLFVHLNATHVQLDFPIIYASGVKGLADEDLDKLMEKIKSGAAPDVSPLFEAIIKHIPAPDVKPEDPFAMLVLALKYDNYKGKMGIGKIVSGNVKKAQNIVRITVEGQRTAGKITSLQMYEGLTPVDAEEATAGDIVAIAGFDDVSIGETFTDPVNPIHLEPVQIEPPTIKMTFGVNTSPFAGKEGKFVTSRNLRDRLYKELEINVALKVEPSEEGAESFLVSGRGGLHLGVLIETMRREGFELQVSQPQVIYHYAKPSDVVQGPALLLGRQAAGLHYSYHPLWLGLTPDQKTLYQKIDKRLLERIKAGTIKEVQRLHSPPFKGGARGGYKHARGLSWRRLESFGLEYKFVSLYIQKKLSKDQMVKLLSTAIKQYSKRQMTWFKRNKNIHWIENYQQAAGLVQKFLK